MYADNGYIMQDRHLTVAEKKVEHWIRSCQKIKKAHEDLLHKGLQKGES
jgi:hypothetical protein